MIYSLFFCALLFCHLVNGLIFSSTGMFWIRLRALGACEKREMEQFAVLSYESPSVSKIRLSYPQRRFPDYSQRFGLNSRVSSLSDLTESFD